jgi:hypothetical protein
MPTDNTAKLEMHIVKTYSGLVGSRCLKQAARQSI